MTQITQTNGPVEAESRIELVDALRGFALAGVLFINLRLFSQYDLLTGHLPQMLPTAEYDEVLVLLAQLFGDGKFITLFSMLFGYGFSLQISRLEARGEPAVKLYVRRALVLLAIGFLHSQLWWGDILRTYAVMAFVLLLVKDWPAKRLAWSGLALTIVCVIIPTLGSEEQAYTEAHRAFSGDSFFVTFRANHALDWFEQINYLWLLPFVLGRFFIGSAAAKAGLLADPAAHRSLLRRLSIAGLLTGIAATLLFLVLGSAGVPAFQEDARGWNMMLSLQTLGLSVAYACWFALLFIRPFWHRILKHLAPVGRMCLTNYLTQTIVCVFVFYGFGLGVGARYGMPGVYVAWAIIFGTQMIISPMWLKRFQYGPAEWVWRSLTYGRYFKNAAI